MDKNEKTALKFFIEYKDQIYDDLENRGFIYSGDSYLPLSRSVMRKLSDIIYNDIEEQKLDIRILSYAPFIDNDNGWVEAVFNVDIYETYQECEKTLKQYFNHLK